MFERFSEKDGSFNRSRPASYEGIVTQKEYETILDFAISALKQNNEILSIKEGAIFIKNPTNPAEEMQCYLDNLVRRCKGEDKSEWQMVVNQHFARLNVDPHKAKYIFKDFDYAEPMIKFVVRHERMFDAISDIVHRVDLPETGTFLVLDTDESFRYIRKDDIKEWGKTEAELFEIAARNVAAEEMHVGEILWREQFEAYTFFSGDFSASYIVELEKNAESAIGKYGAVVAIPTKGSAIVHPINGHTALPFIVSFYDALQSFFTEDQVPISDKYYWYYDGRFELFVETERAGKMVISLPKKLAELYQRDPSV
jgi:uncharacterized protein YtpQ (UPF0354 family)